MSAFEHIGIIIKRQDPRLQKPLAHLMNYLKLRHLKTYLDHSLQELGVTEKTCSREQLAQHCDLVIIIGGDGSFLDAARSLAEYSVPLLGINMGRLGFLVDVSPDEINAQLDTIFDGEYYEEHRAMLFARLMDGDELVTSSYALNDVVIHVRDAVRMIDLETHIDGHFVSQQRADGIVISTPTGSTAYALSGGGPILHPELDAISLVPICPHTLSNRPIVIAGKSEIEIKLSPDNRTPAQVSFDGQNNVDLAPEYRVIIQKKPEALHLIHPKNYDYFEILRKKLHWNEQL